MPSILSILGVIMYMRLPWIVGQAGLISTLGIILVAHIISVTTGLSISSIATDKKVKTGGMYYMISRSLGLPIGGTLGIALFLGISFSISLYIIGFSEAFLSYFDKDITLNTIRLTGLIALSSVAFLTFISTKLAIKSQYFIFAAVILSLLSIFVGSHEFTPSKPNLHGIGEALPWIVLFGIFFPAVTGFGAGVSMSGDLSNPNKAIPRGTLAAIFFGLMVYILLAFFFSYTVSPGELTGNPQVLFDISRFGIMVAIGIWAATLSSALGGVLSAPRILQAMSKDGITPRFFGRGYGHLNEPRNALLLCFIIASAGVMIGELNTIARIVSTFFIITYGFLNLSCFVEGWASTDFKPSFKVHPVVALIGAMASIIVMIQLDLLAMIGATIILSGIFFYLKRRELSLSSGDTWDSVWETIIKSGLSRLKNKRTTARNWRPNIILFSGGSLSRPYLTEIGADIIGKYGILTDFELVKDDTLKKSVLRAFTKKENVALNLPPNVFKKSYYCNNIYEGIEHISQLYGFTGIEPNTVLLGMPNKPEKLPAFSNIVEIIQNNDFNHIIVAFNKEKAFGRKKKIDYWWDGSGNGFFLGLSLLRFLMSGFNWRQALPTLHFVNNENIPEENIYKNIKSLIADYRIKMDIVIHNNAVEKKPLLLLIKEQSQQADLIFNHYEDCSNIKSCFMDLQKHMKELPSMLLIKACVDFQKVPYFEQQFKTSSHDYKSIPEKVKKHLHVKIQEPENEVLKSYFDEIKPKIEQVLFAFYDNCFIKMHERNTFIIENLQNKIHEAFNNLNKIVTLDDAVSKQQKFYRVWNDMLHQIHLLAGEIIDVHLNTDKEYVQKSIETLISDIDILSETAPEEIHIKLSPSEYKSISSKSFRGRFRKAMTLILIRLGKKNINVKMPYKKALSHVFKPRILSQMLKLLKKHQSNTYVSITNQRKIIEELKNTFYFFESKLYSEGLQKEMLTQMQKKIDESISQHNSTQDAGILLYKRHIIQIYVKELQQLFMHAEGLMLSSYISKSSYKKRTPKQRIYNQLQSYTYYWHFNTGFVARQTYVDVLLQEFTGKIKVALFENYRDILSGIKEKAVEKFELLHEDIKGYLHKLQSEGDFNYGLDNVQFEETHLPEQFEDVFAKIKNLSEDLPEVYVIAAMQLNEEKTDDSFKEVNTVALPLKKNVELLLEGVFSENMNVTLTAINNTLNQKIRKINNILSLGRYNLESVYTNEDLSADLEKENKLSYIKELNDNLEMENNGFIETIDAFYINLSDVLKETFNTLTLNFLYDKEKNNARNQVSSKFNLSQLKLYVIIKSFTQRTFEWLLYGRSRGILFAKSIQEGQAKSYKVSADNILNFVDTHTPDPSIVEKLPFYYRNLFNNKYAVNKRFWIARESELEKASKVVSLYKSGSSGALMVLGERNTGKTSFCNVVAAQHFEKDKTYHIFPPRQGSINIDDFVARLSQATEIYGSAEDIMRRVPLNSCFIINDMALWWERSEKGLVIIQKLSKLIRQFGHKSFFIINANIHAFAFINKSFNLDNYLLSVIKCEPFTTFDLRNLILGRHQSSEMTFKLGKTPESLMIEWRYAKLFNSYFDYSYGEIGTALNAWLAHITDVNEKEMIIKTPRRPHIEVFDWLSKDAVNLVIHFVLHRRLDKKRLRRILKLSPAEADSLLHYMMSVRLVVKMQNDVYMLNAYIEPHLVKYLVNKALL